MKKLLVISLIIMFISLSLVSSVGSISIKKDTEKPMLFAQDPPTVWAELDPPEPDGLNGWYVSPVTVSLFADDDYGVKRIVYRSEGPWVLYTEPFIVSLGGYQYVDFKAQDNVGTWSEIGDRYWKKDGDTPTIEKFSKNITSLHEIKFTLKCYDSESYIDYVELYVDGEFYSGQTAKHWRHTEFIFNWTGVGEHKVKAIVYDKAGNFVETEELSTAKSRSMNIILNQFTKNIFEKWDFPILTRLLNFQ